MRRFVLGCFTAIGVLVVAGLVLGAGLWLWVSHSAHRVESGTVLTLDLTGSLPDAPPSSGVSTLLASPQPNLREVIDALDRAGDDPHVVGLVARLGGGDFGFAEIQELRDAIARFRAKGKRAIATADSFGEFGSGLRSYYLATAFDQIWLQPLGLVGLVGLRAEVPFFRGTLDKLGVVPRFDHREQYKTAMNEITDTAMTPAHREETLAILTSLDQQLVAGIAAGRHIAAPAVAALIDGGPFTTEQALAAHLVDKIGYRDEAIAALRRAQGGRLHLVPLARYLAAAGRPHRSGPTIALIYADGLITRGDGDGGPLAGDILGADRIIAAFDRAARDPKVRAILFRIDSPGGSAVASESIWRATRHAEAAGKPVIVSMGDVAGSGGYYIAAGATKIVAEPATLTGSIGVLAGKFLISGLSNKLGVSWDSVQIGQNADMFSALTDFSPAEHARFEAMLDDVYAGFKARVAEGRKLTPAQVEAVAKGRVWTGADAKARGLVDLLGGYDAALRLAKAAAGIPAASEVTLTLFPQHRSLLHRLIARLLGASAGSGADAFATLARTLALARPLLDEAALLTAPPGSLVMAPIELR